MNKDAKVEELKMEFRPCIDIHNGKIKQIVGSSLKDAGDAAVDNFVSEKGGDYFARFYGKDGLRGGHIILLNQIASDYYKDTKAQAFLALKEAPGIWQIGGGVNETNALEFLEAGASHVIVTSYVFKDGKINYDNLKKVFAVTGKEHLVLDLSCRKKDGKYYIVTDRWQKFTDQEVTYELLNNLSEYCDEFLVHAVDVEGKNSGIENELAMFLGNYDGIPVTYAGGVSSLEDIKLIKKLGHNRLNVTIGSALDLFGGKLRYEEVLKYMK